jgi:hypothetical protein
MGCHHLSTMSKTQMQAAHLPQGLLDAKFVATLHAQGYRVHGADLSSAAEIRHGLRVGVDQFSTDALDLALALRSEHVRTEHSAHEPTHPPARDQSPADP